MTVHTAKGKANGDALIAFLNAQAAITTLLGGPNKVDWQKGTRREPFYPVNPYTDCPSLTLRLFVQDVGPGHNAGRSKADATFSLWYKRRQTPGENHQQILIADLETIINLLMGRWRPTQMQAVAGQVIFGLYPNQPPVIHDELHHEFDDPALRVSVAEIPLRAVSEALA